MTSASKSKQAGAGMISEEWETVLKFCKYSLKIEVILVEVQTIQDGMIWSYGAAELWWRHTEKVKQQEKELCIYGRSHVWESVR